MLFQHLISLFSLLVPAQADSDSKARKKFICDQPDCQVLHRSLEDVLVGLEAGHDLLGPLVLPMQVVEGSLYSLQILKDLCSLSL